MRFDLGVESNIRVSRNMTSKEHIEGMFIQEKEIRNRVEFEIQNHLSTSAKVELMEVLPSLQKEESRIVIRNITSEPAWNMEVSEITPDGTRGWRKSLPSGTSQALSFSYVIAIPTDKELVGGNRRGDQ